MRISRKDIEKLRKKAKNKYKESDICIRCQYRKKGKNKRFFCDHCFKIISNSNNRYDDDWNYFGEVKLNSLSHYASEDADSGKEIVSIRKLRVKRNKLIRSFYNGPTKFELKQIEEENSQVS